MRDPHFTKSHSTNRERKLERIIAQKRDLKEKGNAAVQRRERKRVNICEATLKVEWTVIGTGGEIWRDRHTSWLPMSQYGLSPKDMTSHMTMPKLHTSEAELYRWYWMASGAVHNTELFPLCWKSKKDPFISHNGLQNCSSRNLQYGFRSYSIWVNDV